ncbi:PEP-CTERM sorting domain-containing protein [Microvirga sp. 2MCAF38]
MAFHPEPLTVLGSGFACGAAE